MVRDKKTVTNVKQSTEEEDIGGLPIDRGWAWVVCAACFGVFVLLAGTFKTHGMVLVELTENYPEASATSLLWVVNGCSLCSRLSGPIHGFILSKISHRVGLLIGIFLIATSSSVLGYLPSVEYMYPFYTFLFGFGAGLVTLTCYSATPPYFRKKRGLALAITSSGGGGGIIVVPFVLRFLFESFSFSSAMLLYGGIILQAMVLAMLVRPMSFYERKSKHYSETHTDTHKESETTELTTKVGSLQPNFDNSCEEERPSLLFNSSNELARSISMIPVVNEDQTSVSPIPPKLFNWRIIKKPSCIVICIVGFCFECGLAVTFSCLPPLGKENGVSKDLIAILLTTGGVLEIPCRIFNGYLADRKLISACTQLSICLSMSATGALLCGLISGLAGIIIMVVTLSAFSTSIFSLVPLTIAELLGKENLTTALGIVYCFQGLGIIVATFCAGGIYEATHRWEDIYIYSFGCMILGCAISSFYSLHNYRQQKNTDKFELENQ